MKVKEITVGLSGTIPVASYENLKPSYSMTIELLDGESEGEAFLQAQTRLRQMFEQEANRAKADLIEKQYSTMRFYEKDGKKYPSVTSILGWDTDWSITEDELRQYASRGTIVHKLIEIFLKTKKWADPKDLPELREDVAIVLGGSKKLHWNECSHIAFFDKYISELKVIQQETTVVNDEHLYAGRFDLLAMFEGKKTLIDFKCGKTSDFRQLSAYSACVEGVEQLAIFPVGPSDTKQGYSKPKVCDTITSEFNEFLRARAKFRNRFGI